MARHRPQTVCRYGADLVRLVSIVCPGTELLHYCAKTNFAGPTHYFVEAGTSIAMNGSGGHCHDCSTPMPTGARTS
jgi:hypothetical protein